VDAKILEKVKVMSQIKVKQIKSTIGRPESQIKVLKALGLGRIGKIKELADTPSVRGMVAKVAHLVEVVS
jgi:large subunit ribosomal protein L30